MEKKKIKIRTKYGRFLTITIQEQTDEYITGFDKFNTFTKILISDIETCEPINAYNDYKENTQ